MAAEETQNVENLDDSVETAPLGATSDGEASGSDMGLLDSEDEEPTPLTGAQGADSELGAFADSPEAQALHAAKQAAEDAAGEASSAAAKWRRARARTHSLVSKALEARREEEKTESKASAMFDQARASAWEAVQAAMTLQHASQAMARDSLSRSITAQMRLEEARTIRDEAILALELFKLETEEVRALADERRQAEVDASGTRDELEETKTDLQQQLKEAEAEVEKLERDANLAADAEREAALTAGQEGKGLGEARANVAEREVEEKRCERRVTEAEQKVQDAERAVEESKLEVTRCEKLAEEAATAATKAQEKAIEDSQAVARATTSDEGLVAAEQVATSARAAVEAKAERERAGQRVENALASLADTEEALGRTEKTLEEAQAKLETARKATEEARGVLAELDKSQAELEDGLEARRKGAKDASSELRTAQSRVAELTRELGRTKAALQQLDTGEVQDRRASAEGALEASEAKVKEAQQRVDEATARLEELTAVAQEAEVEARQALEASKAAAEETQSRRETARTQAEAETNWRQRPMSANTRRLAEGL
jgi:hypothetical protein